MAAMFGVQRLLRFLSGRARLWVAAYAAVALLGCSGSRLPSYGAPQASVLRPEDTEGGDLVAYRTLTRGDFLGSSPQGAAAAHTDKMGAQTFTLIKHDPGIQFAGEERQLPDGTRELRAQVRNLYFRAWMDRSRSWWNPTPSAAPEAYILQHEQIHFALSELEARVMNAQAAELMQRTFEASNADELKQEVEGELKEIMKDGMERLLERNTDFDEDTSGRYEPAKQNEWWARVQRELASGG